MSGKPSFYDRKRTGGVHNSLGMRYQDLCSLILFVRNLENSEFRGVTLETIDDFTLHFTSGVYAVQVKKYELNMNMLRKELLNDSLNDQAKRALVFTQFDNSIHQLLFKRNIYINEINSQLSVLPKEKIQKDFKEELEKIKLGDLYEQVIQSEYHSIPEEAAELILKAELYEWCEKNQVYVSTLGLLNSLRVKVQDLRCIRGSLSLIGFHEILKQHSIKPMMKQIVEEVYKSGFFNVNSQRCNELCINEEDPLYNKLNEAESYTAKKEYDKALKIYLEVIELYPKEEYQLQCAMLFELTGKYQDAIMYCNEVLAQNSKSYEAYWIKGTCLGSLKEYNKAAVMLNLSAELNETCEIYHNLGYTYWMNGDRDRAIENYSKALQIDNDSASTHCNISICYFEQLNVDNALFHVNKALELNPNMFQAWGRKGELYRFLGMYKDAIYYFSRCLEVDKTNFQALLGKVLSYLSLGNIPEMLIYLKEFIEVYKGDLLFQGKKSVMLVDIGWERTIYVGLRFLSEEVLEIEYDGVKIPIRIDGKKEVIMIGCEEITNDTGSILYPIVGKIFKNNKNYRNAIARIKESVDLLQIFEGKTYIDFNNSIEVVIEERVDKVFIHIIFANKYHIVGVTDSKFKGFSSFVEHFERSGQCKVLLIDEEKNKEFIIECVKKVDIKRLK